MHLISNYNPDRHFVNNFPAGEWSHDGDHAFVFDQDARGGFGGTMAYEHECVLEIRSNLFKNGMVGLRLDKETEIAVCADFRRVTAEIHIAMKGPAKADLFVAINGTERLIALPPGTWQLRTPVPPIVSCTVSLQGGYVHGRTDD